MAETTRSLMSLILETDITNRGTSFEKALDVYNASTERLANVQQCGYHGGMNQKWILRSAGDGYYYIISANNGMYMDLPNADISPGNSIWMNWGNGSPAEKWKFESTTEKERNITLHILTVMDQELMYVVLDRPLESGQTR